MGAKAYENERRGKDKVKPKPTVTTFRIFVEYIKQGLTSL